MTFRKSKYELAREDYEEKWAASDEVLYDLCKRFPDHQHHGGIHAKLWVIGRAYATGIERKIKSKGTQGSSMEQLADHIWRNRSAVDRILRSLRGVKEPLTAKKLGKILFAHRELLRLVQKILRHRQTPRSFVSKYLHFHNPAVPIFDGVAVGAARKHCRRKRNCASFQIPATGDKQYNDYLLRFWRLYQEARKSGVKVSVKLLDNYLLALAREAK